MNDLEERIFNAYFRRFGKGADQPCGDVDYIERNGLTYARRVNVNGILAVYRVKDNDNLRFIKAEHFYKN